jgi:hypothetical protein
MTIIDPDKGFKIVHHATVIIGQMEIPGTINGGRGGHDWLFGSRNNRGAFRRHPGALRTVLIGGIIVGAVLLLVSPSLRHHNIDVGNIRVIVITFISWMFLAESIALVYATHAEP